MIAFITGTLGALFGGIHAEVSRIAGPHLTAVPHIFGGIDPNSLSAWTLVGVNALTAIAGGVTLFISKIRQTNREEKLADDKAFKESFEGKIADLEHQLDMEKQRCDLLAQKVSLLEGERDFLHEKLESIRCENQHQSETLDKVAENVKAVGDKLNAPTTSVAEPTKAGD